MCFVGLNRPAWEGTNGHRSEIGFVAFCGVGLGCSGIVIPVRHDALPGSFLGRSGAGGNGRCGGRGGIAWTAERRSPGSRRP
jgi:hypothetical protein